MNPILSVRNLCTGYGKKQVLFDVNLDVMPGEVVLITGGNGSGKSTLLKAIYGLVKPWNSDAQIIYRPDASGPAIKTDEPVRNLRQGLAYLPQKQAVFDELTVDENLSLAGYVVKNRREFAARRGEILASFPMLLPFLSRKPGTMSGGERQMLSLAMVLLHRPRLLLLDEPTAGIDVEQASHSLELLGAQVTADRSTLILIEHSRFSVSSLTLRNCEMVFGTLTSQTHSTN